MMSAALIPASELVSEDWQLVEEGGAKPTSLVIQLRRRAYVLPYFRFLYAEGDNAQLKVAFASHLITVTGSGLGALLAALAGNVVVRLIQPTENEAAFGVRGVNCVKYFGPSITDITIEAFE